MDWFRTEEDFKEKCGYTIDDVWYPRVTKIVTIKSKPALYRYYGEAKSYKAAQESTQKSAEEGTMIHEAVEAILTDKTPEVPEVIVPAISAFREFIDEKSIQVLPEYVEKRVMHPMHRYAGTVDSVALIDGKFGVLDVKTSLAIYRDYNLQTSSYVEALKDDLPNLQTRWILRIDQGSRCLKCDATRRVKGDREKIKMAKGRKLCEDGHEWTDTKGIIELQEFPFWRNDFEAFLSAKRLWEWENEYWLKRIGYLEK